MHNNYDYFAVEFQPQLKANVLTVKEYLEKYSKLTGRRPEDIQWVGKKDEKEAIAKNTLVMAYWPLFETEQTENPQRGEWYAATDAKSLVVHLDTLRMTENIHRANLAVQKRKV